MIIGGIDPSFSCAGVAVMDTESKEIRLSDVREKIGRKSFENVFWASLRVHEGVRNIIECLGDIEVFISETPYSGGQFSSGLHTLDATMFLDFIYRYKKLQEVYLISSRFLTHVHSENGISNYSKSDSTKLVREGLFPVFEDYDYNIEYGNKYNDKEEFKGGINNNSAEAFIFLSRIFVTFCGDKLDVESGLLDDIYQVAKGLFDGDRENLLFNADDIK